MGLLLPYLKNRFQPNATAAQLCDIVKIANECYSNSQLLKSQNASHDAIKNSQPVVITTDVRGEFNETALQFFDIDSTIGVDDIINGRDRLFSHCPWILSMQKSVSGKLHIFAAAKLLQTNERDWQLAYNMNLANTLDRIVTLFGVDYYNIDGAVDTHSAKFTQILYISENPVYENKPAVDEYNQHRCLPSLPNRTYHQKEDLYNTYKLLWSTVQRPENASIASSDDSSNSEQYEALISNVIPTDQFIPMITIDRHMAICGFTGNDIRWRLSLIAQRIFGDRTKARNWLNKYFINKNKRTIYSDVNRHATINPALVSWLVRRGYLKYKDPSCTDNNSISLPELGESGLPVLPECNPSDYMPDITLTDSQYLSDVYLKIENIINLKQNCEFIAPTGIGKTELMKHYLAQHYKCIIVNPCNANNSLYTRFSQGANGLDCVCSATSTRNKNQRQLNDEIIHSGKSFVTIYDQFVKYFMPIEDDSIDKNNIANFNALLQTGDIQPDYSLLKNYQLIIIDEVHTLYSDRSYRESVRQFCDIIKRADLPCQIVGFTATIGGESQIIPNLQTYTIDKKQLQPLVKILDLKSNYSRVINQIINILDNDELVQYYDHIVLFDNQNSRNLEDFIRESFGESELTVLRAERKRNGDSRYNDVIENELIKTKYVVSTNVAFQGLNFKNDKIYYYENGMKLERPERILCIFNYIEGVSYKQDVIQCIGRFRKCTELEAVVICSTPNRDELTNIFAREDQIIAAEIEAGVDQRLLNKDKDSEQVRSIKLELEKYRRGECSCSSMVQLVQGRTRLVEYSNIETTESAAKYSNKEQLTSEEDFICDLLHFSDTNKIAVKNYWYSCLKHYTAKLNRLNIQNNTLHRILVDYDLERYDIIRVLNNMAYIVQKASETDWKTLYGSRLLLENWLANNGKKKSVDKCIKTSLNERKHKLQSMENICATVMGKDGDNTESIGFRIAHLYSVERETLVKKINDAVYGEFNKAGEQERILAKQREGGQKGGKIGSPTKKVRCLFTGLVFDSLGAFAAANGHTVSWASKRPDLWEIVE